MTGFLAHLAQRSLDNRSSVRPRPVSLYETRRPTLMSDAPLASSVVLDRDSGEESHPLSGRRFPVPPAPPERRTGIDVASPSPEAQVHFQVESASPPRPDGDAQSGTWQRPPKANRARVETDQTVMQDSNVAPRSNELAGTRPIVPAVRPPSLEQTDVQGADAGQTPRSLPIQGKPAIRSKSETPEAMDEATLPTPERTARAVQPVQFHQPEAARAKVQTQTDESQAGRPRSQNREAKAATIEAVLAPRLPQPGAPPPVRPLSAKAERPVIHVTIGRVEIRAVSAPAAPKRTPAPSKPALSLNDYLQRRSKVHG